MSLSYVPLKPVLVEDPITQVGAGETSSYAILQGGDKISFKSYTSTSIAASSIQWSCPPPAGAIITDRNVMCTLPVRLTFTGTVTTNNSGYVPPTSLLNAGLDAPRAWPISGSLESLQANINNDSISIPLSDMVHALTRYNIDQKLRAREYSTSCTYPDQSFNYADLVGTNRNPLAGYGNSISDTSIPRGGFPFTVVSNPTVIPTTGGTGTTAIVDMVLNESLLLSPYYWGCACGDVQGFYNVTSMDFNFSFLASAGFRMWSHCPVASTSGSLQVTTNITGVSVQFNGFSTPAFSYAQNFPQLLFKYITPNVISRQVLGPQVPLSYPYFQCDRYPTDIGAVAYGNPPTPFSSNNLQLNSIPRRIYVYARPSNSVLQSRCDITDCYLALQNIQIQWTNQSTLLSAASQVQLYEINVKNHSSQDWSSWSGLGLNNSAFPPSTFASQFGGVGSVMCLEFGTDIQLDSNECPGLGGGQYQLQITCSLANLNSSGAWDNINQTLYIIVVSEGTFTVSSIGSAQHQQGVVGKMDVLDAQKMPGVNYRDLQSLNGGDFLSSLRDFGSKINNFLKQSKIVSTVGKALGTVGVPFASTVGNVASSLGYGGCDGGVAIQGGKRMTKKQMRSRL